MKYLMIANGPFLPNQVIYEAIKSSTVIVALDGAVDKLIKIGIKLM